MKTQDVTIADAGNRLEKTKPGRLGTVLYLLVAGLVIGNFFYFAGFASTHLERITWEQWLSRLDCRYWPVEAAYVLWFIFTWLLIDAVTFRRRSLPITDASGEVNTVRVLVLVLKLVVPGLFVVPLINPLRIRLIRGFLMEYYFMPMSFFFYDFTLSWKLALPPLTAILAIGLLLRLKHSFRSP